MVKVKVKVWPEVIVLEGKSLRTKISLWLRVLGVMVLIVIYGSNSTLELLPPERTGFSVISLIGTH